MSKKYIPTGDEMHDFLEKHELEVMQEKDGQIKLKQCPFCGSGEDGKDAKCSGFYISQNTGDFVCFRKEKCGASGTYKHLQALMLLRDTGLLNADIQCGAEKIDKDTYNKAVSKAKEMNLDVESYGTKGKGGVELTEEELEEKRKEERENKEYTIINLDDIADRELTGANYDYIVNQRKISPDVCKSYHIVDYNEDYIFIPHCDLDGNKVLFGKIRLNHSNSTESKEKSAGGEPHFFGLDHLNPDNDTLIITEGQIDALSVLTAKPTNADVISVPLGKGNLSFISDVEKQILSAYDTIIVFGDFESGKISMVHDFEKMLPTANIEVVRDYKGCKDANEMLCKYGADAIVQALNDTSEYNPYDVSILDVDITKKTRERLFTTGVSDIDQMINGIEAGTLTLLLSKEGMGKSTIALQLALQAADAGVHSYIYSGEMDNADVVKTLLLQCAGPTGTGIVKDKETGVITPYLRFADWLPKMQKYLNKYITIYNPKVNYTYRFGDKIGTEAYQVVNNLISEIERKAAKGKVKFFVVDNMMSLLIASGESNDLFTAQGLLAQKLKDIAVKYNVAILLCVHARKSATGQLELTTDDISGSSTVKNLSDVIISLEKFRPLEVKQKGQEPKLVYPKSCENISAKPTSQLRVLKNRHHSLKHSQGEGALIWYVPQCKTIYGIDMYEKIERDSSKIPPRKWMQEMAQDE